VVPRVHAPAADRTGAVVTLPDDEAAHLTRVLRLKAGSEVRVFDGQGHEWHAVVRTAGRRVVTVELGEPASVVPEPRVRVTLGLAVLKGDRMDAVIRDAVMLGAWAVQPLITMRTEPDPRALERGRRLARWRRIAVASAKQCGRAVVPALRDPITLTGLLGQPASGMRVMLAEPAAPVPGVRPLGRLPRADAAEVLVGPEGGWTAAELQRAADAGAALVTLGRHTLRADAVPLIALTALRIAWDDF
jgi:16S rRNA (uracil1498-N3)-methyltransferase